MKKFFDEFKAFALKGNVMDMAIGVIIGGAFKSIVDSLTENIINPLIGLLFNLDLSEIVIPFDGVSLGIGAFISSIINFILLALVLFCIVKAMNKLIALRAKPAEPETAPTPTQEELLASILDEMKKQNAAR